MSELRKSLSEAKKDKTVLLRSEKDLDAKYQGLKKKFKKWINDHSGHDISREYSKAGGHKKINEDIG